MLVAIIQKIRQRLHASGQEITMDPQEQNMMDSRKKATEDLNRLGAIDAPKIVATEEM